MSEIENTWYVASLYTKFPVVIAYHNNFVYSLFLSPSEYIYLIVFSAGIVDTYKKMTMFRTYCHIVCTIECD
jgi:hypothetical protein